MLRRLVTAFLSFILVAGSPYRDDIVNYNLNTNQLATDPSQYSTNKLSSYTASPTNWRALPVYTILLDKFADGDPSNNDFFGTMYENDYRETQLRYGGDLKGLVSKLDYIHGMGVRVIFISGTPFLNMLWQADSYSPLDLTVLDPHWGTIADWQATIAEIHSRGMFLMADFTVGTMADLIGFQGYLNTSTPFELAEHNAVWKDPKYTPWNFTKYRDFSLINERNTSCVMPDFWNDDGTRVVLDTDGCLESDFDQYGDMEAFGVHPDWQRQLSKFASVQDRLREWKPSVLGKLKVFSCMAITALDIDAIRIDKATQVTVDALAEWASSTRSCAAALGKNNFYIPGEVTGGNTFGSLYIGRGRTPTQRPPGYSSVLNYFLREAPLNALDGVAFHYSTYRALTRFLGMDGNLQAAYDTDINFITAWHEMFVENDLINSQNKALDPRHILQNGTQMSALGSFITSMVMPGIPLLYYGEEQNFYLFDTGAANYLYGRQAMTGTQAWKRHGCYGLGSEQYYNFAVDKALIGCHDDWNALDHFDPTMDTRRLFSRFLALRRAFPAVQDGFDLTQQGSWTYTIQRPGSDGVDTEMGLWSVSRQALLTQTLPSTTGQYTGTVWMLFTNENTTKNDGWMKAPFTSDTPLRNLFAPYEQYKLTASGESFNNDSKAPYFGCLPSITMEALGFKALVPTTNWVAPSPALTKFTPGHDARILVDPNNSGTQNVTFEFNTEMSCDGVTNAITFNLSSSGHGGQVSISGKPVCGAVSNPDPSRISGGDTSAWRWSANLANFADGILSITIANATSSTGAATMATDTVLLRRGQANNVMIFPENEYDTDSSFGFSNGQYTFAHKAYGAEKFRYSWNFGRNWTQWTDWEDTTVISKSVFSDSDNFWDGDHIMVQYWSQAAMSTAAVVHADYGYSGSKRRVPQFLARGPFNSWGFDSGISSLMTQNSDGLWELEIMASWPAFVQLNVWGFDDYYYGDTDGDGILDRLPPNTAAPNFLNMSAPPSPHLAWALLVDDSNMSWSLEPRGEAVVGAIMYTLLLAIPLITGTIAALVFMWSFYGIKHNRYGVKAKSHKNYFPILGLGKSAANDAEHVSEKLFGHKHNTDIIGWPEDKNKRRKVLIATLEYEIMDWKLKVKIGGLGVMSSLMGKAMTDVDLVWVVPKVKDVEYPAGEPAEPIEVIIFGEPYLIEVETHVLDNITYVILDSPVFRAQTKSDPYPARMDDLSSAIFYSTWNQAIAATIRRSPTIDIYHINDYHGALAAIYLLPKVIPVCLSLHNAEFQGLWPLRTKEEMKEVCSAFNISKEHCTKYKSVGVAGVSDKYGKRSWARYPALWTLKHVDSLPNPDPSDIAALDESPTKAKDVQVDQEAEALRPELKRQAQEWAGIAQDPHSDLFVFVGRWSKQKGVDLIADIMPSMLEKRPSIQLICVGPVIDLYGRFAAEKLARLMELYPTRVFSKPEFTALPPYLFSGADFALIPSRDEPFGLVAVEFGRKGALGVGSRLGGLGLMPGWWYPVESSSAAHMLSQLGKTIKMALKSTEEERAVLRARSAVQRFPVVEWRQRMEDFHKRSINISRGAAASDAWRESDCDGGGVQPIAHVDDWNPVTQAYPSQPDWDNRSVRSIDPRYSAVAPGSPTTPGQWSQDTLTPTGDVPRQMQDRESTYSSGSGDYFNGEHGRGSTYGDTPETPEPRYGDFLERVNKTIGKDQRHAPDPFLDPSSAPSRPFGSHSRVSSVESISSIVDEKSNSPLNKAIASFTDADGGVASEFVQKLQNLNAKNSEHELSIDKFLMKSEEAFFGKVRKEQLSSSAASIRSSKRESVWGTPSPSIYSRSASPGMQGFGLDDYDSPMRHDAGPPEVLPMTRLQIALSREIGGWPLYTIIIAFGQMISASSFQITLLTGRNWQDSIQLYVLGGVFLAASFVWYPLFRLKPSVYVLSIPWIFFGLAFFMIGLPSIATAIVPAHRALANISTWCYAAGSAALVSGSARWTPGAESFSSLNFGESAGGATEIWIMRACVVQGTQQVWVAALWYWGYTLNGVSDNYVPPWFICIIVWPLSVICFVFAYLMLYGLPEYYRQTPPKVPQFFQTLFRRKLVLWFLASEILRDYWLSGPYGRNWTFLWSVDIPKWQIGLLILAFFVVVWTAMLLVLSHFSKTHTWFLPVFAVGLGAPRWCQMLWGTSSLALYIPWAGSGGPYLGISLWLWLGVLDAVQGVGLGMILLQTLSRLHVGATLAFGQVIGAVCVMVAHATAPNRLGPSTVFPDAAKWDFSDGLKGSPMAEPMFWIALVCQLVIVGGYGYLFRGEQLSRP
ncbi:modular protein with glycoside hydrolase family 13 and glycosyltransferase family 5 domains [Mycena amicta]|nr:modular protein with glycoside hydrolase family 13 and glycosyltransferase family 5 domains [Mycena amicta]